ncbi:transposase [Streptomyces sp. C10-9-1]|uniref:transposase n=1 Tax=Streptomyces sp. C10-9-1 TaxID=1859285 RepID=UPI003F49E970
MDDDLWAVIERLMPPLPGKAPGPRPVPDRPCLQGILYVRAAQRHCLATAAPELGFGSGRTSQAATTSITHACNARRGAVMRRIT